MWTLLMIALGIFIGWQIPQPEITKRWQTKAMAWVRGRLGQ